MESGLNEDELRDFFQRLGHARNGCSEWLLVDPRSNEVRGAGFFTDADLLVMAAETYVGSYSLQVCRNPRPQSCLGQAGARNQFNRALTRPTAIDFLETLDATVFLFRAKGKQTLDEVGALAAGLVGRLGITEYSAYTAGTMVAIRVGFEASPLRRFGGPDQARNLFVRLEEHFRESLNNEERAEIELIPSSGPDLFDPALGVPQMGPTGMFPGRWIYAPAEHPDMVLDQMLSDLQAGKSLKSPHSGGSSGSQKVVAARTEGLVTEWDSSDLYQNEKFEEGGGIIPRGAKLEIESEEGKQAKSQLENLDNLAREAFLGHVRSLWKATVASKAVQARSGGTRSGEVWLLEGNSYRAVQDWLCAGLENILRAEDVLAFWASSRMTPGSFLARGIERIAAKPLDEIDGIRDPQTASQAVVQYRQQFKRQPVLFPHAPGTGVGQIIDQISSFRHSDDALANLPGLLVLDGFEEYALDHSALQTVRQAALDSSVAVWLGGVGDLGLPTGAVDVRLRLILGEGPLRQWLETVPDTNPEKPVMAQILPRLYPEVQQGRVPCVITAEDPHAGWTVVAYHLYYPVSGRFQSIIPKQGA